MIRASLFAAVLALATLGGARAAEVRVLSAGAVELGLEEIVRLHQQTSGDAVKVRFATGPELEALVGRGETADILIAPEAVLGRLAAAGKLGPGPSAVVGRVGVGVVVKAGAPHPDVATPEALKSAVMAARTVVYNRGSTGVHMQTVFDRLGWSAAIAPRAERPSNGEAVVARISQGAPADIGFAAITEIALSQARGAKVDMVGPLPAALQNTTVYAAQAFSGASPAARAFLAHLTGPEGEAIMKAKGVR